MKKTAFGVIAATLLASTSLGLAADLPRKGAPAAAPYLSPAPAFTWTGVYVGVNGGYAWDQFTKGGKAAFGKSSGGIFGATVGYNYQVAPNFVVGLEGDADWASLNARKTNAFSVNSASQAKLEDMFTLRARAGYSVDRALVFVTGGYAGANVKSSVADVTNGIFASNSAFRSGYALGGGLEYAFTNNISAKGEYIYSSLGEKNLFGGVDAIKSGVNVSTVKAGLNYRFW